MPDPPLVTSSEIMTAIFILVLLQVRLFNFAIKFAVKLPYFTWHIICVAIRVASTRLCKIKMLVLRIYLFLRVFDFPLDLLVQIILLLLR